MLKDYRAAMETFLSQFDLCWEKALQDLGSTQAQLSTGNRLRPQICLWGYLSTVSPANIATHDYTKIANIAVSIELVHKASLLIDDWIDGDQERHGKPAFHIEYTPQYAVLVALNMIGLAMVRMENIYPDYAVLPHHYSICLNTLLKTIYCMAQGALNELQLQGEDFFDGDKIKEITQLETADIIGNSFLLGYYAGIGQKHNPEIEVAFKQIGDQCGFLFQAFNDLEVFGNPEKLRKHKGSVNTDYAVRRKNLAIARLYSIANKKDQLLLLGADEEILFSLVRKYKIVETTTQELKVVYNDILRIGAKLQSYALPVEWCDGLRWFLDYVKRYAEERLKG